MKTYQLLLASVFSIFLLSSCQQDSLQQYFVDAHENSDFMAFDFPASLLRADQSGLSPEEQAIYASIKKVNMVAMKYSQENSSDFDQQELRLKDIMKNTSYTEMMKFNTNGMAVGVYILGDESALDEIVLYGYKDKEILGVARIIGDKMDVAKLMDLSSKIDIDPSNLPMGDLQALFGS